MNVYYRWRLDTLLRDVRNRKEYLEKYYEEKFLRKYGYMPNWDLSFEMDSDKELTGIYEKINLLLKQSAKFMAWIGVDN